MTQGIQLPTPSRVTFNAREDFLTDVTQVACYYRDDSRPFRGPIFKHTVNVNGASIYRKSLVAEAEWDAKRKAFDGVVAQVEAHRAVTEPWPT